jgi:hypothetical protein
VRTTCLQALSDQGVQLTPDSLHGAGASRHGGALAFGPPSLGGIDRGLREHAATQQNGDLLGVDIVVFGLAPVDRFHIQRVPEDKGCKVTRL